VPYLRIPPGFEALSSALHAAGVGEGPIAEGLVFVAAGPAIGEDFAAVQDALEDAFRLSQSAAREAAPIVYVVAGEDLLGQRGAPAAMVACGLLSAARTAALEGVKPGFTVNVVAPEADADVGATAVWVQRMLESEGATGELVRVGPAHLGKALP
jgi:NAD(P)-dependent dehydrogenase (short-subunit alcohol dehydrogenase family)